MVLVAILGGLAAVSLRSNVEPTDGLTAVTGRADEDPAQTELAAREPTVETAAEPLPRERPASERTASETTAAASQGGGSPAVLAAQRSLAAWASFASTGSLDALVGTFATDGPQYRQLSGEAAMIGLFPPRTPVGLALSGARVRDGVLGPIVRGVVTYRAGADTLSWCWDLHLRPEGEGLVLWTAIGVQNPSTSTISSRSSGSVAPNSCA